MSSARNETNAGRACTKLSAGRSTEGWSFGHPHVLKKRLPNTLRSRATAPADLETPKGQAVALGLGFELEIGGVGLVWAYVRH